MNKRQRKKYIHKQVIKHLDGCGLMPKGTIKQFESTFMVKQLKRYKISSLSEMTLV